jgi:hypothetical protein
MKYKMSRDSSVGITTGYGLDDWGSIPCRETFVLLSTVSRPALGDPPKLISNGYRDIFSKGVKRQGREADHSPPSSAKVKNGGAVPPLPNISSWSDAE